MSRANKKKQQAKASQPAANWTVDVPHKWCGKIEQGRLDRNGKPKPNKAQQCQDCLEARARILVDRQKDEGYRREEKIQWQMGGDGDDY